MKKNRLALILAVVFSISMLSCGGGNDSPGKPIKEFYGAVADGKFGKASDYVVKKDGVKLSKEEKAKIKSMVSMMSKRLEQNDGFKEVKILKEEIAEDGKSADVEYEVWYKNGEKKKESQKVVNVDGEWYIPVQN
jgi:hypothetical protein